MNVGVVNVGVVMQEQIPSLQRRQVNQIVLRLGYRYGYALGDIRNIGIECSKLFKSLPVDWIVFSLQLLY